MINDPWKDLVPPHAVGTINARRVDADMPWGFFWACDTEKKYMLILQHSADSTSSRRLPKLKGIEITVSEGKDIADRNLILKLLDTAYKDIFYKLCVDIISSTSNAGSEREAVEIAIARTWRWHHLLRGGSDGRLSIEEQKGLIGEIIVMERYLLPRLSTPDAVNSWRGPLGAPKDFEIGRICIEAKARRGVSTPYIAINSEHQLDDSGTDYLYLHVIELDQTPSDTSEGFDVSEVIRRVYDYISGVDDRALIIFEDLLYATGFRWEDDYSDSLWIEGSSRLYRVDADFPRITAQIVMSGVSNVKYSISLAECEPFRVNDSELESSLEVQHGN